MMRFGFKNLDVIEVVSYMQHEKDLSFHNFFVKINFDQDLKTNLENNIQLQKAILIGTKYIESDQNSSLASFENEIKKIIKTFNNQRFKYNYFHIKDEELFNKE